MFIRTRRLFLRPAWIEDARALCGAIAAWDIVKNLASAPWPYGMAEAESFLAMRMARPAGPQFVIFERTEAEARLVGTIGLDRRDDADEHELGYWIAREAWGRGYATEAGQAILRLAFDGLRLPAVEAGHFIDNPASGAVLRKLGFRATGEVRGTYSKARDAIAPSARYVLDRENWCDRPALCLAA
ncbi:GNAT family N-acetyltransferase [Sphingoaurantiacus capsulatus]|uniref:GNAT family N-acetyltransferase n=1 Tax=Sphingoaurantiacus capsulatus TaxID=1771310 RepID=A0ABV7X992_9SPHN